MQGRKGDKTPVLRPSSEPWKREMSQTKMSLIRSLLKRQDEDTRVSHLSFIAVAASVGVAYLLGVVVVVVVIKLKCRVRCNID